MNLNLLERRIKNLEKAVEKLANGSIAVSSGLEKRIERLEKLQRRKFWQR